MSVTLNNHTTLEKGFIDLRFPEAISCGSMGGPTFFTDVNSSYGGYEQRNINWDEARNRYNVGCDLKDSLDTFLSFFRIVKGRGLGFLLKDWTDFSAKNQVLRQCPENPRLYHFVKSYGIGQFVTERRIFKPYNAEIVSIDVPYNIDYAIGVVEFESVLSVGTIVRANFNFDVPVRMDADNAVISVEGYKNYICNDIRMIELKFHDNCSL